MNEIEVGSFEAKNRLSALIDEAAKGQRIWITKRGKRVALLSSGQETFEGANSETILANFRKFRGSAKTGKDSLKSLVEEGRR